jgi:hypothetical protein
MSENSNLNLQRDGSVSQKSNTSSPLAKSRMKSANSRGPSVQSRNKKNDEFILDKEENNNQIYLDENNLGESKIASPNPIENEDEESLQQEKPLVIF